MTTQGQRPAQRWPLSRTLDDARALYVSGPLLQRTLQHYRPHICPFELVMDAIPHGASVLDVGCGGGLFLGLLARAERISRGVGFDVSHDAIAVAREMAERTAPDRLTFQRLDVDAPWPEGPFDCVSIIDVMHHVPPASQRAVLETAVSRLAAGGRLIYKDMCRRPRWRAAANRMHDLLLAKQWIHYAPIEQVERWMEALGFACARRADVNRLWYGHELRVFRRVEEGADD